MTYPSDAGQNATYTYDQTANGNKGVGHLTAIVDAAGSENLTYDSYGNLSSQGRIISGVTYTISYAHDLTGNLTQITYPSGRIVNYQRDVLGQIATVTTQANAGTGAVTLASNIQYLPFGPAQSLSLGNGQQITFSYDQDYRLTRIVTASPARQDLSLGYDGADNITTTTDAVNSNRSQSFQYDLLGRITQGIGYYGTDGYTWDAVGNRLTRSIGTTSVTYSYARGTNHLSSAATVGGSTLSYSYDAAGDLTTVKIGNQTQAAYTYNAAGRMASGGAATYKYDGLGRRLVASVSGTATHFLFGPSGESLVESNASGQPQRLYIYLSGRPLALVDSTGTISYILSDQLGQPQQMVSGTGVLTWDRIAGIFGDTVAQPVGASATNPLRFPGQQQDATTGLHYNYFRDYDPKIGRYVQSDPVGLNGGINPYRYAANNPISKKDPLGTDIMVMVGGWNGGYNVFGHVSAAVTGAGVYSSGTGTAPGSSATAYVTSQSASRNQTLINIPTTPEQDAAALNVLQNNTNNQLGIVTDNCADRTADALRAAGIGIDNPIDNPLEPDPRPLTPADIGQQLSRYPTTYVPQGGPIPDVSQFNPK